MLKKVLSTDRRSLKVVICGALGRAGKASIDILCREADIDVVGVVDILFEQDRHPLPGGKGSVPATRDLEPMLANCQPDVLVDFTEPSAVMSALYAAADKGIHMVMGTTGLSDSQLTEIDRVAKTSGIGVLTGTLSLAVALAAHLASLAAAYFDHAEIVDLGKLGKKDAPSGAAIDIAKAMVEARGRPFEFSENSAELPGSRGWQFGGVPIHSLRLSDCYIHETIYFGKRAGTLLTIGLELTSAEYLDPGITIAVRESVKHKGLVYGLDELFLSVKGNSSGQ